VKPAALLAALAVALAPLTHAQTMDAGAELLGSWTCEAAWEETLGSGAKISNIYKVSVVYFAGGRETFKAELTSDPPGDDVEFSGTGEGTWELQPDGRLTETVTSFKTSSVSIDGVDKNVVLWGIVMEKAMRSEAVVSTIEVSKGRLRLVNTDDNTVTTCTRRNGRAFRQDLSPADRESRSDRSGLRLRLTLRQRQAEGPSHIDYRQESGCAVHP
jgi:hypothetical protein